MKVNSLFMYPSITKYQANFESTSSVINYDVSRRFLWSLTFMTIVLTVQKHLKKIFDSHGCQGGQKGDSFLKSKFLVLLVIFLQTRAEIDS